jgi:hypothetical protein
LATQKGATQIAIVAAVKIIFRGLATTTTTTTTKQQQQQVELI